MAENTKIEWADHTFNPWTGCTKVGPGCDNCYAEGWAKRSGIVHWGTGAERRRTSESNWKQPIKWNAEAERLGLRYRVFCASLADVFDNEVPAEWRADLFDLIAKTPNLDWLLVTKRIGNAKAMMADALHLNPAALFNGQIWPLPNVWLGITVVNQAEADRDIPKLLSTPAAVRFLSIEPMLGPVDLTDISPNRGDRSEDHFSALFDPDDDQADTLHYVDWVIVGGESGPKARPMHPKWVRDIRDQCDVAGVPFLFKQWGEWSPRAKICGAGEDFQTLDPQCKRWPSVIRLGEHGLDTRIGENCTDDAGQEVYVQRVGKKTAGRLLDGQEHNGFPSLQPAKGAE